MKHSLNSLGRPFLNQPILLLSCIYFYFYFFVMFAKGDNFRDFMFASLNNIALTKWSALTGKNLLLRELTSMAFKGRQIWR